MTKGTVAPALGYIVLVGFVGGLIAVSLVDRFARERARRRLAQSVARAGGVGATPPPPELPRILARSRADAPLAWWSRLPARQDDDFGPYRTPTTTRPRVYAYCEADEQRRLFCSWRSRAAISGTLVIAPSTGLPGFDYGRLHCYQSFEEGRFSIHASSHEIVRQLCVAADLLAAVHQAACAARLRMSFWYENGVCALTPHYNEEVADIAALCDVPAACSILEQGLTSPRPEQPVLREPEYPIAAGWQVGVCVEKTAEHDDVGHFLYARDDVRVTTGGREWRVSLPFQPSRAKGLALGERVMVYTRTDADVGYVAHPARFSLYDLEESLPGRAYLIRLS